MGIEKENLKKNANTLSIATLCKNAHVTHNHINISEEELKRRLIFAKKEHRYIDGATSFFSYRQAEEVIVKTIMNDNGECSNLSFIVDWLNDESDWEDLDVELSFDEEVGYGFFAADTWEKAEKLHGCRVALKKLDTFINGFNFLIISAYPIK